MQGGAGVPTIDEEMDSNNDNKGIDDQEQEEEEDQEYLDEGQGLDVTGSEVKRMRVEIHRLREENHYLVSEQLQRETEIRMEVSEEMVVRSAHLLDQIQDLQEQLHSKESQVLHTLNATLNTSYQYYAVNIYNTPINIFFNTLYPLY